MIVAINTLTLCYYYQIRYVSLLNLELPAGRPCSHSLQSPFLHT